MVTAESQPLAYHLLAFGPESPLLLDAVRIYAHVWRRDAQASEQFIVRHRDYPDFYGCLALYQGQVIGMGYGTHTEPGQWWHDRVAEQLGPEHPALQDSWVLSELAVLEAYRSLGVGKGLLDNLLQRQPYEQALLSTQVDNVAAQRFYLRHGWTMLHPGFAFYTGGEPYCIMHRVL